MASSQQLEDLFVGDGRNYVDPIDPREGTRPIKVTRAQARAQAKRFEERGRTTHSQGGATLWVTEAFCKWRGIPYTVHHDPEAGYDVIKG